MRKNHWDRVAAHLWHEVLVGGCLGGGQQRAAKRLDVIEVQFLWGKIKLEERAGLFLAGEHVHLYTRRTLRGVAFHVNGDHGALQIDTRLSFHDEIGDLGAALEVLFTVPAHSALLWLLYAPDGAEAVVGVALGMLGLFGRRLVAPDLFVRLGETVPAVCDDAGDVAVVVLDVGADLLGGSKGGAEEHESVPGAGNVVWVLVARGAARGGDGHVCEGRDGRKSV